MCNNSEYDSEDDDGYFLTPVLHYDISNKIIEANKVLFEEQDSKDDEKRQLIKKTQRYVTFAKELVSFAPNIAAETPDAKDGINDDDNDDDVNADEGTQKIVNTQLIEISNDIDTKMKLSAVELQKQQQNLHNLQDNKNKSLLARDPPFHASASTIPSPLKLKEQHEDKSYGKIIDMAKEIIGVDVEVVEEEDEEVEEKLDIFNADIPEELSNSVEKIIKIPSTTTNNDNVINNNNNTNTSNNDDIDNDDDDCLSIQVGVIARNSIRCEALEKHVNNNNNNSISSINRKLNKNRSNHKNKNVAANIKFNYKICCEYAAVQKQQEQRLPEYKGLISEYGLSRKERERLMQHKKRQERSLLEMEMRSREDMLNKLTANEKAFTTWLRNKCRQLPNRTRNMFDFNINKRKNNNK